MSGPILNQNNSQRTNESKMIIDKPHAPFGAHVDIVTPFGQGADKMRVGTSGQIISHELILKGGNKIKLR